MSSLDFSHFKKIGQDKKSATLRHPDGHEIKIAIINLNPALRKKLDDLPLHQAEGSKETIEALDDESPAKAVEEGAQEEVAATPPQAPQAEAPPAPIESPVQAPPSVVDAPAPAAPTQAPVAAAPPSEPMTLTAPAPTPEQEADEKTKENVMVGQDLSLGHIKPQTYRELFNKKDTLGKVGTLFGLLLSGAGAGLTHQPNALLAMMDKQIANDLEAQKTDQSNKQNWYKLSFEHTRTQAMNALTNSEAFKNATATEREQMINHQMGVVDHQASADALNYGRMAALQDQQNNINKMPAGPQREGAQNLLNNLIVANHKQMYEDHLKVAQNKPQMQMNGPSNGKNNPPPAKDFAKSGVHYSVVDQNKLDEGLKKGLQFGDKAAFIKGAIPQQAHASINKEIEELGTNRNNWADANDAFDKLIKIKNAGQVPGAGAIGPAASALAGLAGLITTGPGGAAVAGTLGHFGGALAGESVKGYFERERQVQVDALVQRLRSGGMGDEAARSQAESILPKWSDKKEQLPEVHYQLQQHFKAGEDNKTPTLKQYGLLTPQPKYKFSAPKDKEEEKKSGGASGGY